jgi:hypothetical protein
MSLQIQVTADVANAGKQIEDFSKKSRTALNNLSLVAQDLPFGFIGIQNNLPGVISSFGELTKEAGGVGGAFKQLSGALIGPAGLFLAFSVVTSAVTMLTLKYGSLGAALDALFTKQTKFNEVIIKANESLKEYNKSIITNNEISGQAAASQNGQVLTARALLGTILDLSKTEAERKNALERLKKLDEERFKNFDIEKGKINGLEEAVASYTRALIAQSVASKFVEQVSNTSVQLEIQRNALGELYDQLDLLQKTYPNLAYEAEKYKKEVIDSQGRLGAGMVKPTKGVIDYIATLKRIGDQEGSIKVIVKQLEDLNSATLNAVQSASALASPFAEKELKGKKPKKEKELDLEELSRKARIAAQKLQNQADKNRLKYLQEQLKLEEKLTKEFFKQENLKMNADAIAFAKISFDSLDKLLKPLADFQKRLEENQILLNEVFFNPLQDAFMNLFETGKFGFKAFADAVLMQIKQLVAKILATGIISLIANIVSGGLAGGIIGGGSGILKRVGQSILGAIGIGEGGIANPSFGGVGPGSMGMSGQVNVVLRGSDLVGALNRTNATINRVG